MNVNEFLICLGLLTFIFMPAAFIGYQLVVIEQYIQRIESRLDKYKSNQKDGEQMSNDYTKNLYIALDLARFLSDDKRANNTLSDGEKRLAQTIADKIVQSLGADKDK